MDKESRPPTTTVGSADRFTVRPYGRHFAVWEDETILVAVVCFKRGAREVARRLNDHVPNPDGIVAASA